MDATSEWYVLYTRCLIVRHGKIYYHLWPFFTAKFMTFTRIARLVPPRFISRDQLTFGRNWRTCGNNEYVWNTVCKTYDLTCWIHDQFLINFIFVKFMTIYDLFNNWRLIWRLVLDLRPLYTPCAQYTTKHFLLTMLWNICKES